MKSVGFVILVFALESKRWEELWLVASITFTFFGIGIGIGIGIGA